STAPPAPCQLLLRPPPPPLFPYTTLFRSHRLLLVGLVLPPFLPGLAVLLLSGGRAGVAALVVAQVLLFLPHAYLALANALAALRSEEHTSELQSRSDLVCRLLLEKKN